VRPAKRAPEINVEGRMRDHGTAGSVARFRDVVHLAKLFGIVRTF
jgi:hypothetical protein